MKRLVLISFLFGCANMTAAVASEKYITEFYDTGQTKVEKTYKNGKLNGPFKMYFRDGRIMMQGTMKDGKKDGDWVVYYFNGEKSLYASGVFRDGKWVAPSKN